jgi:TolB protein
MGPAWSPDGTRIAFVSLREPGGGGIAVIPAGGGPVTLLTDSPYSLSDGYPSWSPDGSQIVFSRWSPDSWDDLWIVPVDGGTPVPLTDDVASHENLPVWSPDGGTIAFTSDRSGTNQIWTMPVRPPISIERSGWGAIKGRYRD